MANPPQDSWMYQHLSMGRKKSRGTLELSRAEDDHRDRIADSQHLRSGNMCFQFWYCHHYTRQPVLANAIISGLPQQNTHVLALLLSQSQPCCTLVASKGIFAPRFL